MSSTTPSSDFLAALMAAFDDHDRYGKIDSGDWEENGAMRAVGIARSDSLRLATQLLETYGLGLATGWDCPECGRMRDEDGDCPEGHEFDVQTVMAGKASTLLAIVEMCLATGVHLERARWELLAGAGS